MERQITTGVPFHGKYKEILNTDSMEFDGTNLVNSKPIASKEIEWDDRPESITVKLAPLSVTILKFVPFSKADLRRREEEKALIQAKEALRASQEAEKQAQEAAQEAARRAELLAREAKEAKLAAKHAMESLEKAKLQTTDALALVQTETEKLESMKAKKED